MGLYLWLVPILPFNWNPWMINPINFYSITFLIRIGIRIPTFILVSIADSNEVIGTIKRIHLNSLFLMWRLYHISQIIVWRFIWNCNNLVFFVWTCIVNDFWWLVISRINRILHPLIRNITICICLINPFWGCLVSHHFWRSFIIALKTNRIGWIIVTWLKSDSLSINCSSISLKFLIFLQIYASWCNCIFCLFLSYSWWLKMIIRVINIWLIRYSCIILFWSLSYLGMFFYSIWPIIWRCWSGYMFYLAGNSMDLTNIGLLCISISVVVSLNIIITSIWRRNIIVWSMTVINIDLFAAWFNVI